MSHNTLRMYDGNLDREIANKSNSLYKIVMLKAKNVTTVPTLAFL